MGERSGALQRLIDGYKFQYAYNAHQPLAQLLLECLDELPADTVIVPIPTVRAHVRQRGYDHTLLIARYVAKKRKLTLAQPLYRLTHTRQRGATKAQREQQAKAAFGVRHQVASRPPYLLIDDVITTGATLRYAAKALKEAGADTVWAAVIARQPLD